MQKDIYIAAATRTPIGNFLGGLSSLTASDLGKIVINDLVKHTKIDASDISQVILGQVLQSACGQNPARQASIKAGIPKEIPAWTINQVCGSGLRAVALAFQSILCGDDQMIIAGGQESMSNSPHAMYLRQGIKMGDGKMLDTMIADGLWDHFNNYHMGVTAENIAKKYSINREMQDEFSCNSQNKAEAAQKNGRFNDEITKVIISSKKGDVVIDKDEFPRHGTTIDSLSKLKPAFDPSGTVTAGNSSGINDGAAVLLVVNEEMLKKYNLKPLVRIVGWASAGVDPAIMGTGPIATVQKLLKKVSWNIQDLDLIEANEAFAAQAISVNMELGWDVSKVNVNGGAVALGHPIGASGARILVSLIHEMQKRDAKKGLATLCIGGGMGVALAVER